MDVDDYLSKNLPEGNFVPYTYWDSLQKTLSVHLAPDEYYVEKINEDIDVFKSFEESQGDGKIVGCRLKLGGKFIEVQQDDLK